jgi:hypothetical protein
VNGVYVKSSTGLTVRKSYRPTWFFLFFLLERKNQICLPALYFALTQKKVAKKISRLFKNFVLGSTGPPQRIGLGLFLPGFLGVANCVKPKGKLRAYEEITPVVAIGKPEKFTPLAEKGKMKP